MLVKLTLVLAVVAIAVVAVSGRTVQKRQLFDGQFETAQIAILLKNKAFVHTQAKCAMATEAQAAALCDRIGNLIRKNVPGAIRTLKCPGNCTNKEKRAIALAYDIVVKDYPELWNKLLEHYKITAEQKVAMQKELDVYRKLPEV